MLIAKYDLRGILMTNKKEEIRCVRCHSIAEEKDRFCVRCGAPLFNRCSNGKTLLSKGCNKVNRREAAYCSSCGAPTVFYLAGLVEPLVKE